MRHSVTRVCSLPEGIDVRGIGGYVIAPGATLPDGRGYRHVAGSWDAIPALPKPLVALLKAKRPVTLPEPSMSRPEATEREGTYAEMALTDECAALSVMRPGEGRNIALNTAAYSVGTMVGAGWIEREIAEQALWEAAERNLYRAKDGDREAWKTLQSGIDSGIAKPSQLPANEPGIAPCHGIRLVLAALNVSCDCGIKYANTCIKNPYGIL